MEQPIADLEKSARGEAEKIKASKDATVFAYLNRVMKSSPGLDTREVIGEVKKFHVERMGKVPSKAKYPEAQKWAEHQLKLDARVKELAGLSDEEMAVYRSFASYMTFRGYRKIGAKIAARSTFEVEKCRVAYVPDTDKGVVHIKNLDDPITYWKKRPAITEFPGEGLQWDATGSGLHMDNEPEDTFPLPVPVMCKEMCTTVPQAVEFLTRYCSFYGKQNILLFDGKNPTAAVEKCSYNFIQVNPPDKHGRNHISGMVCRDINSPIGKHQAAMRAEYVKLFGLPQDGPDVAYWAGSGRAEVKLAKFLSQEGPIKSDELIKFFITPRAGGPAEGLNKNGDWIHPKQEALDWTLATTAYIYGDRTVVRWQRDPSQVETASRGWPAEPERYAF
jgi:hypothetical protein